MSRPVSNPAMEARLARTFRTDGFPAPAIGMVLKQCFIPWFGDYIGGWIIDQAFYDSRGATVWRIVFFLLIPLSGPGLMRVRYHNRPTRELHHYAVNNCNPPII